MAAQVTKGSQKGPPTRSSIRSRFGSARPPLPLAGNPNLKRFQVQNIEDRIVMRCQIF